MTTEKLPPDWAIERALTLTRRPKGYRTERTVIAFAQYIAAHEQPPVDPLLIEARDICRDRYSSDDSTQRRLERGEFDHEGDIPLVYEALKRGIKIGKSHA